MRQAVDLFRKEPRARVFFVALTQSSLGTGAGYVALLLIAYDRLDSAWAISLVLLADLMPAMALGPLFGAAADRWSRRGCAIAGDLIRAVAFVGIAVVDDFGVTLALALLAGTGTALFNPSSLAALPSLVDRRRLPAATATYGAIADLGYTAGPAIAAGAFLVGSPETIMAVNGATFAVSAVLLAALSFGATPRTAMERPNLLSQAREGIRAAARMSGIRIVLGASAGALFFGGAFNVAELPFSIEDLGAGKSGYSVLVTLFGLGFILGSLAGSEGGAAQELKRRYLVGLLLMGTGFLASGLAPHFAVALATFALAGFGNGLVLVYERLLIQRRVPDAMAGRVFGVKDALTAWAFGVAFIAGGALVEALGPRTLIVVAGAGGLAIWVATAAALRRRWQAATPDVPRDPARRALGDRWPVLGRGAEAVRYGPAGEKRSDFIGGRDHWLAVLDDLGKCAHDSGVELAPGAGR